MSDKPVTIEIPEELLQLAEASHLDLRQIMIDALEQKRQGAAVSTPSRPAWPSDFFATLDAMPADDVVERPEQGTLETREPLT